MRRRAQGPEVRELTLPPGAFDDRREVPDSLDIVIHAKESEVPVEVEPTVGATLQGAVVQVGPVDVDDAPHDFARYEKRAATWAAQPAHAGELCPKYRSRVRACQLVANVARTEARSWHSTSMVPRRTPCHGLTFGVSGSR